MQASYLVYFMYAQILHSCTLNGCDILCVVVNKLVLIWIGMRYIFIVVAGKILQDLSQKE